MIRNIVLIILSLAGLAVILFLDVPGVQSVLQLRTDIETQKQALIDKQDLFTRISKLSEAYKENKDNIDKMEMILPAKEDVPNLLVQVESLVFEQGLILNKLELSAPTQESGGKAITPEEIMAQKNSTTKGYKVLNINLGFTGDYSALKNFLKAVEENIRLIDVEVISIAPESEGMGIFKFDLSLKTYYQN